MKRVGRLNGKTIIQGDQNTVTPNQILAKIDPTNGGGGSNIELKERTNTGLKNITSSDNSIYFTMTSESNVSIQYICTSAIIKMTLTGEIVNVPIAAALDFVVDSGKLICYCINSDIILPINGSLKKVTFDEIIEDASAQGITIQKVNLQDLI